MATQGKQWDFSPAAIDKKGLHSTLLAFFKRVTEREGKHKHLKTMMGLKLTAC